MPTRVRYSRLQLTHANEFVHFAAHIVSFAREFALPPLRTARASQWYRPRLGLLHCFLGR
jgi:hypothetical protein